MKYLAGFFIISLVFFLPLVFLFQYNVAFGACGVDGLTVVYVNGIFISDRRDADTDRKTLEDNFEQISGIKDITFLTGYNSSHLAGMGDIAETTSQILGRPVSDYDRDTILLDIYPKVETRKILFVGHSQGTFYTNEIYKYLADTGKSNGSIAVYNVATPASFVAGGSYLTSSNDKVINKVRAAAFVSSEAGVQAKQPLQANIAIPLSPQDAVDSNGGHSFSGVYLANAAARIVSGIENALQKLVAGEISDTYGAGCFIPPAIDLAYKTQKAFFSVADPAATAIAAGKNVSVAVNQAVYDGTATVGKSAVVGAGIIYTNAVDTAKTAYANIGKWFSGISFPQFGGNVITISADQGLASVIGSFSGSSQSDAVDADSAVVPESDSGNMDVSNAPQTGNDSANSTGSAGSPQAVRLRSPQAGSGQAKPAVKENTSQPAATPPVGVKNELSSTNATASESIGVSSNATATISNVLGSNLIQVFSGGGGGVERVADSSPPVSAAASPPAPPTPANHIVIGEILFDAGGTDVGKEFIELYNPNETETDVSGWSLKYRKEGNASTTSLASFKTSSHPEDKTLIQPKGFLLVGLNDYDSANYGGKSADVLRTASLPNGESGGSPETVTVMLSDAGGSEIDRITYDKNSIAGEGRSIERKIFQSGACASSQGSDTSTSLVQAEFSGNDCDRDHNFNNDYDDDNDKDFELRTSPNPQNSGSLPEPRSAPTANNLGITYDFAPRFDFSWSLSSDSSGSTSTLSYSISDTDNSSSTSLLFETSSAASSTFAYAVNEVGRDYHFKFTVQDRDGLFSAVTSTIAAKSFLDSAYFYRDTRGAGTGYLFDITTSSSRPFWDKISANESPGWKAIVFYLNKDAPKQDIISTEDSLIPASSSVRLSYSGCGSGMTIVNELIFPLKASSCVPGPLSSSAYEITKLEDLRLAVSLASSTSDISFSPSDYMTAAFYDFGGGGGGRVWLQLAAVDKTNYHFQAATAAQGIPAAPGNFSADFSASTGALNLSWSSSTDSDTLDYLIHYEVNFSTSTAFDDSAWVSTRDLLRASTIAVFPNTYKLGVRAVDDFGNALAPSELTWNFPAGFVLVPSQLNHNDAIGLEGFGQQILMGSAATIGGVGLFVGPSGSLYNSSQSYVEIRQDDGGSPGALVATSAANTMDNGTGPRDLAYSFSPAVSLNASSSYWLTLKKGPSGETNGTSVYGTFFDSYPDGVWEGHPAPRDMYFRLIQE